MLLKSSDQGCQICLGATYQNIPKGHKIYQMAIKYTKWPYGYIVYRHFSFFGLKIFGMKILSITYVLLYAHTKYICTPYMYLSGIANEEYSCQMLVSCLILIKSTYVFSKWEFFDRNWVVPKNAEIHFPRRSKFEFN
jgi:hypothetical protein